MEQIKETQQKLSDLRWIYWQDQVLFTWQWWLLLFGTILLSVLWIRFVSKERLVPILLFGSLTLLVVIFLDVLGAELLLWEYPKMVLPWGSRIICIDIMIAVFYMFVYQWARSWPIFLLAMTLLSAGFSFLFEPFSIAVSIYIPYNWSLLYSFPIYIAIGAIGKAVTDRVVHLQNQARY